jgi:protein-tyrosine phosphatase
VTTDLYWVPTDSPGRLAIMPRPRGGDWLADEVRAWRRAGVDVVASLLTPDEAEDFELAAEADAAQAEGIAFVSLPVPDRELPPSRAAFAELADRLAQDIAAGRTVVVHCRQGIGRAGMLAAAVLIVAGLTADAAVARVSTARGRPVPETPDQLRWLHDFARTRTPAPASNPP